MVLALLCLWQSLIHAKMLNMAAQVKLDSKVKQKLVQILQNRSEILFAILYGSVVEGISTFQDLDIGIWIDRTVVSASADLDYAFTLADELERHVSFPVDVRLINDAPLGFRYNVSRGEALLVNNEEAFFHFLERTWDEFLDFQPTARQYLKELQ